MDEPVKDEGVEEQLSFMNDLFDPPAGDEGTESEAVPPAVEAVEPVVEAAPIEIVPATTVVTTEAAPVVVEQSTEEILREQILALTAQLQGNAQRYPEAPKPVGDVSAPSIPPVTTTQQPITAQSVLAPFLTAEELDEIIDKPELILTAIQRSNEHVMQQAKMMVSGEINRQIMITKAVTEFYDANKDLAPYASFVQHVMAEQEGKSQDKTYAQIFADTASECRKRLGLKPVAVTQQTKTNNGQPKPAFAGSRQSGGNRVQGKNVLFDENARDMF